jgi:hypothetical protein
MALRDLLSDPGTPVGALWVLAFSVVAGLLTLGIVQRGRKTNRWTRRIDGRVDVLGILLLIPLICYPSLVAAPQAVSDLLSGESQPVNFALTGLIVFAPPVSMFIFARHRHRVHRGTATELETDSVMFSAIVCGLAALLLMLATVGWVVDSADGQPVPTRAYVLISGLTASNLLLAGGGYFYEKRVRPKLSLLR